MLSPVRRLLAAVLCLLLLAGCDLQSNLEYWIRLPSGTEISYQTNRVVGQNEKGGTLWEDASDAFQVIEGTPYRLDASFGQEGSQVMLCDGEGEPLYSYAAFDLYRSVEYRGEAGADGTLWFCAEWWDTLHMRGYIDGTLKGTVVFWVDPSDGAVLFRGEADENELFLTARGDRVYFYQRGAALRLFGRTLYSRPARIYYRTTADWDNRQEVYRFDFYDAPPDTKALRFSLGAEQLTVQAIRIVYHRPGYVPETYTMEPVYIPLPGQTEEP